MSNRLPGPRPYRRPLGALALLTGLVACLDEGTSPGVRTPIAIELSAELRGLDRETEGEYEAWVIGRDGVIRSAGRFDLPPDGRLTVESAIEDPEFFMVTVEPPGDGDPRPSLHKLLGGRFEGGVAVLSVERYVTASLPLEPQPGSHVLATLSDNDGGNVSNEESGLWLFNAAGDTLDGSFYLDFTPLTEGWSYEGWIVRDRGTSDEVWLSYGKFVPDGFRQCNSRDDTGLGPFSGIQGYDRALPLTVRIPGDDWLANPGGFAFPTALSLPLDLNGDAASSIPSRWTHVISIEPWGPNRDAEPPALDARPFFLQPYRNAIGEGPAAEPRVIQYDRESLPTGVATVSAN